MKKKDIPARNFILIVASIFLVEFAIMHFLDINSFPSYVEAIVDSILLIVFTSPFLYFFLHRPLKGQIRDLENVEAALTESKAAADSASLAKSEFIANMSHEIRTPLTTILGMVELLKEESLNKEQQCYLDMLVNGTDNLLEIVNDVLDLSKIESGHVKIDCSDFDLKSEMRAVGEMFCPEATKKGLTLDYKIDADVPALLKGDYGRIRQILVNIISNALKFTSKGGVVLSVNVDKETDNAEKLKLLFTVTDTGIGIDKGKAEKIFESFVQANSTTTRTYGGTGLGLYISKKLVELMEGCIWVESDEGKGSSFFFTLYFEVPSKEAEIGMTGSEATDPPSKKMRPINILVVEDSNDIHLLIKHYLKHTPYRLSIVENGKLALEKFKSNKYDLLLMDMEMPVMDGYMATKKIREWEKERGVVGTPIVALTAHALKEFKQRSIDAGCDAHYSKPIRKLELLELIDEYAL